MTVFDLVLFGSGQLKVVVHLSTLSCPYFPHIHHEYTHYHRHSLGDHMPLVSSYISALFSASD